MKSKTNFDEEIGELSNITNMRISYILNIVLIIAVIALVIKAFFFNCDKTGEGSAYDNIMSRTSIRAYQDKPVEEEKVEKMLRAAMAAPTAGNKQPWRFVVIKEKETLKAISDTFHTMRMAVQAPLAIVVCADMHDTFEEGGKEYWVQDASAATENLLLAAHDMGLGAVWCGIYPMRERVQTLSTLLNLPSYIIPLNVVPIGYPAENPTPKDKWKPGNIHQEKWSDEAMP